MEIVQKSIQAVTAISAIVVELDDSEGKTEAMDRIKKLFIAAMMLCISIAAFAQFYRQNPSLEISLYNNATLLPGQGALGLWGTPVHPGVSLGYNWQWCACERHPWGQSVRLSYHFHRFVQHSVALWSESHKSWLLGERWRIKAGLGLGYLHAFSDVAVYEFNSATEQYERAGQAGRAQWVAGLSFGPEWQLAARSGVFLRYQFYVQSKFVREYVPILPNTAWHLGFSYAISQ